MIKIIGEDSQYVKHCSCKTCAAKLEYTLSELKTMTTKDYTGGSDTSYYINCPRCNAEIYLPRH